jgi:hypothetical protein
MSKYFNVYYFEELCFCFIKNRSKRLRNLHIKCIVKNISFLKVKKSQENKTLRILTPYFNINAPQFRPFFAELYRIR